MPLTNTATFFMPDPFGPDAAARPPAQTEIALQTYGDPEGPYPDRRPDGRIVDANGNALRCVMCSFYWATFRTGTCTKCGTCRMCARVAVPNPLMSRYCESCSCGRCHVEATGLRKHVMPNGKTVALCTSCMAKVNPLALCGDCKRRGPTYHLKGSKQPRICASCAGQLGRKGHVHYCNWCTKRATTVSGDILVCSDCSYAVSHKTDACNPAKQCDECRARGEQNRTITTSDDAARETARVKVIRTDRFAADYGRQHETTQDGVPCSENCTLCYEVRRNIFLKRSDKPIFMHATSREQRQVNKSQRLIGVEIEVCGLEHARLGLKVRNTVAKYHGAIVHDGSLPSGGFEINSTAASGDLFVDQVKDITDALDEAEAFVTEQAGLHVHVDCADHTYSDMRKLISLYAALEPALIRTQPASRVLNGSYCRPCGKTLKEGIDNFGPRKAGKKALKAKIISNTYREFGNSPMPAGSLPPRQEHHNSARYRALNVHSWFYRGTVECRMHEGTVSGGDITSWGMLWASIVDTAYRMTDRQVNAYGTPKKAESLEILLGIAPNDKVRQYITSRYRTNADGYEGSSY